MTSAVKIPLEISLHQEHETQIKLSSAPLVSMMVARGKIKAGRPFLFRGGRTCFPSAGCGRVLHCLSITVTCSSSASSSAATRRVFPSREQLPPQERADQGVLCGRVRRRGLQAGAVRLRENVKRNGWFQVCWHGGRLLGGARKVRASFRWSRRMVQVLASRSGDECSQLSMYTQ